MTATSEKKERASALARAAAPRKRTGPAAAIALVAVLGGLGGLGTPSGGGEALDEDPFRAAIPVSPRVLAGQGVDAPIVIVTVDGVRWQEIFEGTEAARSPGYVVPASELVPNLYKLGLERGAFVGAPGRGIIAASGPNYISLPGYTEILGGRRSPCRDNQCPRTSAPTLFDEARAAGAKVAAFSSWDRIDFALTAKPGSFVVSCGQREGREVPPSPGHGKYRPDRVTAEEALAYFETERPDVFFLGLGDTDEYAHRGDYARYIEALKHADEVVGRLMAIVDRDAERGESTHIVVTTDHGREASFHQHGRLPEAARVWMVAAGPRFRARGPIATTRRHHLADIAPTLRVVLGLAPDPSETAGRVIDALFQDTALGLR